MTINATEKAILNDNAITHIDKRHKPVYCTDNGKRWNNTIECARELGVKPHAVRITCQGQVKTCKGLHLSYQENIAECMDNMSKRTSELSAELEKVKQQVVVADQDVEDYLAWKAEREAKRQEEEKRLKAIEELETKLSKANIRYDRRHRLYERAEAEAQKRALRLSETETEIAELEMELLKLKGDIK